MNKVGEGRISTYIITIILCFGAMMLFVAFIGQITNNYGVANAPEFEGYAQVFSDLNKSTDALVKSQESIGDDNETKSWVQSLKDTIQVAWEDSILRKAWATIKIFPDMLSATTNAISLSFKNVGISVPFYAKWLVVTILAISFILVMLKVIWGKIV